MALPLEVAALVVMVRPMAAAMAEGVQLLLMGEELLQLPMEEQSQLAVYRQGSREPALRPPQSVPRINLIINTSRRARTTTPKGHLMQHLDPWCQKITYLT